MPRSTDFASSAVLSPTICRKNTPKPHTSDAKSATSSNATKTIPFALYVNFLEPHFPYTGPLNDYYDPDDIPQSPIFMEDPPDTASLMHQLMAQLYKTGEDWAAPTAARELRGELISKPGQEESDLRQIQARYAGLVTLLDRAIEKILNKLDELGLSENTIVVFTSRTRRPTRRPLHPPQDGHVRRHRESTRCSYVFLGSKADASPDDTPTSTPYLLSLT